MCACTYKQFYAYVRTYALEHGCQNFIYNAGFNLAREFFFALYEASGAQQA
jgi:hypothetical protein